ncbi:MULTISPECIES: SDR family NAD(P)-dependent oxidoreductase [unclassified Streptomyces]|uniref:SDR family NAD(P)-dependent oxidoreductase n=1 Tax=unclassified Streptomyces TaxID=2593676 RepID=UPI0039F7278A
MCWPHSSPRTCGRRRGQRASAGGCVGGIDVLVNNAGASSDPVPAERSDASWHADLEVNLLSAVRVDRVLVPGMIERGFGVVVYVSSIASRLTGLIEDSQ